MSARDEELLCRIAAGDLDAMAALFCQSHRQIYQFALHLTGSESTADDVTQEVFIAVIKDASRFVPGRGTVTAWLCGVARNFVRRRLQRDRRLITVDEEDIESALPAVRPDALEDLTQAERLDALRRAVLSLPLRYREVVVLCDLQEMPYAEAADALGCAIGTVRSRLHRARALLTAKMQAEQERSAVPARHRFSKCIA